MPCTHRRVTQLLSSRRAGTEPTLSVGEIATITAPTLVRVGDATLSVSLTPANRRDTSAENTCLDEYVDADMGGRRRARPVVGVVRCAIRQMKPANRLRVAARAMPGPFALATTITEARGTLGHADIGDLRFSCSSHPGASGMCVLSYRSCGSGRAGARPSVVMPSEWSQPSSARQIRKRLVGDGVSPALSVVKDTPTTLRSNRARTDSESAVRSSAEERRFS